MGFIFQYGFYFPFQGSRFRVELTLGKGSSRWRWINLLQCIFNKFELRRRQRRPTHTCAAWGRHTHTHARTRASTRAHTYTGLLHECNSLIGSPTHTHTESLTQTHTHTRKQIRECDVDDEAGADVDAGAGRWKTPPISIARHVTPAKVSQRLPLADNWRCPNECRNVIHTHTERHTRTHTHTGSVTVASRMDAEHFAISL